MFETCIRETFLLVGLLSGVPLAFAMLVGLGVSVIQAATQIQEQTIQYAAKLSALVLVLALFGSFGSMAMIEFMQQMLGAVVFLGRL